MDRLRVPGFFSISPFMLAGSHMRINRLANPGSFIIFVSFSPIAIHCHNRDRRAAQHGMLAECHFYQIFHTPFLFGNIFFSIIHIMRSSLFAPPIVTVAFYGRTNLLMKNNVERKTLCSDSGFE